MGTTLLLRPAPRGGESAMGYLLRLVEANALDSPGCIEAPFVVDLLLGNGSPLRGPVGGLSALNGPDAGGLPMRFWNVRQPRFCPRCLGVEAVWKALWQLSFYVACHTHRVKLRDGCHQCGSPLKWRRPSLLTCRCGADLRASPAVPADDCCTGVSREIEEAWARDEQEASAMDRRMLPNLLDRIWLLGSYRLARGTKAQKLAGLHLVGVATSVVEAYGAVVNTWPQGFFQLLDDTVRRYGDAASDRLTLRFGGLYKEIFAARRSAAFGDLRAAFEQYVLERWPGQLAKRNRRLSAAAREAHVWVPLAEAARELHWRPARVREAVSRGALRGDLRLTRSGRTSGVVHRDALLRLKKEAADWVSLKDVCRLLRAGKKYVKQLMSERTIVPVVGPSIDGYRVWQFRRADAERLAGTGRISAMSQKEGPHSGGKPA